MNLIRKLNYIFLNDEQIALKDYILFYGWIGALITFFVVTIILNITF